ncbi:helix-turn-helix transcriptional regulator [Nocardiopsis sp. N85]|uniref:helix-turn-helix domain-containing protein n=1 Tax=Nocardiopsis sp. N85 TaxID=3029400 RepID=UPI00237F91E4|nr:helix-turn-helix transcriptional regulator [Nocardiopsis sp. N85]MDE3724390.1 helix-turn-helix transcriptional regulator [Nocardiopsis sp. N85]
MSERYSPTVRRRRLSEELRRLRHDARMTLDDVVKATEWSRGKLGNIESGERQRPQVTEIRTLLDTYGVTDHDTREAVLDLCRQSRERGWWVRYRDVLSSKFVGFEAEASTIYNWELAVVPGLLQVPAYTELITQTALVRNPKDVARVVDARIKRQRVMFEDPQPPDIWFVFDEIALVRLRHHPEVLRAQIANLIEAADDPRITIQIVPYDRLHPGTGGPFVIMDFPNTVDPSVVYLETDTDGLYLEEAEEVARYRRLFDHLRLAALLPEETLVHLREMTI